MQLEQEEALHVGLLALRLKQIPSQASQQQNTYWLQTIKAQQVWELFLSASKGWCSDDTLDHFPYVKRLHISITDHISETLQTTIIKKHMKLNASLTD